MTDDDCLRLEMIIMGNTTPRCGETYRRGQLVKLEKEIEKTIKDLDTYNVSEQIRLSKELVKLFEMKKQILGFK